MFSFYKVRCTSRLFLSKARRQKEEDFWNLRRGSESPWQMFGIQATYFWILNSLCGTKAMLVNSNGKEHARIYSYTHAVGCFCQIPVVFNGKYRYKSFFKSMRIVSLLKVLVLRQYNGSVVNLVLCSRDYKQGYI